MTHRVQDERVIVTIAGEVDVFTSPQLRDALQELISAGQVHLVVSLREVDFIDSTGLGVLVGVFHRLKAVDGSMVFADGTERVRKVFFAAGLSKIFHIYPTLDEALTFLGRIDSWPILVEPQLNGGNYLISVRAGVRRGKLPASLRALFFWTDDFRRVSEWYSWSLPV